MIRRDENGNDDAEVQPSAAVEAPAAAESVLPGAIAIPATGAATAREEPLRFIHVLQRTGYGDMAAEYLNLLAKRPDLLGYGLLLGLFAGFLTDAIVTAAGA